MSPWKWEAANTCEQMLACLNAIQLFCHICTHAPTHTAKRASKPEVSDLDQSSILYSAGWEVWGEADTLFCWVGWGDLPLYMIATRTDVATSVFNHAPPPRKGAGHGGVPANRSWEEAHNGY